MRGRQTVPGNRDIGTQAEAQFQSIARMRQANFGRRRELFRSFHAIGRVGPRR